MSSHRRWVVAGGILIVGLSTFVVLWFQPQKLFIDDAVEEAVPVVADTGSETGSPVPATKDEGPRQLAAGDFRKLEHETSGRALLLELADGRRFLRFENLQTSNGPDLRVYLSEIPVSDDWFAYGERFVDLGPLKGNVGDQNYEVPRDLELSRYKSAVIWCRRFTVGFGVAPLEGLR